MHPAMLGGLIGLALAIFFVFSEYVLMGRSAAERGKRLGRKNEPLNEIEKNRIKSVLRFAVLVPPVLALMAWIVLPKLGF
jgi:uncharacterized membrane protein